MSVRRRLLSAYSATLVGPLVTVLVQLVNVPVMLRCWGPELYGGWLMLTAIPAYLLISDLGFGNAAGNDMTVRVSAGDPQGAVETFHSVIALVLLFSAGIAASTVGLLLRLPSHRLPHLPGMTSNETRLTLLLLSLNCLAMLQWSVLMAGFRCCGRYARGVLAVNCIRIVEAACSLAVLFIHARPVQLAALMLTVSVAGTLWLLWDHRRNAAWLPVGMRCASAARIRDLAGPALAFMAFPACAAIGTQGMVLAIGATAGPAAVALFSPMRTLARLGLQLTDAIKNSVWPELCAAFGHTDWPLARRLHRSALQASVLLAGAAASVLALSGASVFAMWTHGHLRFDAATFDLLLLSVFANAAWNTSSAVPLAANRHGRISVCYLALSVCSLGLAALLLPRFGLAGAALAMLCADAAMGVIVLNVSLEYVSDPWREFLRALCDLSGLKTLTRRGLAKMSALLPPGRAGRSIPSLDGLRAVAVFAVMLSHFNGWSSLPRTGPLHLLLAVVGQGGLGVSIFFVISGYLITTLLLNEQERSGAIDLGRFYLRRAWRIFPPYYVYLTVAALVAWLAHRGIPGMTLLSAAGYVSNYYPYLWSHPESSGWYVGHTWSLSVEEQFYLAWPLLLVMFKARQRIGICMGAIGVAPLLRVLTVHLWPIYAPGMQWYRLFHTTMDALACGCLMALLMRHAGFRERVERLFHPAWLIAACAYLAASSALLVHAPIWFTSLFGISIANGCISLLVLYVIVRPRSMAGRLLNWRAVRHVGAISYSLYLWQQLFLGPFWTPNTVWNMAAALVCAEVSYRVVEMPSLRLRGVVEARLAATRLYRPLATARNISA
jgi:peptidoglycan/LPS O-acetylase OafA/YrhL/O-antigen/teichoic acid export membrane protein